MRTPLPHGRGSENVAEPRASASVSADLLKLPATALEKVWGTPLTDPWYSNPEGRQIGEVWFTASAAVPLVKFLFTSDNLSVQVHPVGKTEMWHVLRAGADAKVAIGLKALITRERLREVCLSGEIMDLLNWISAKSGDTFFSPAGTIHAIGGNLVICEVQQPSDITYRLFDYHRPDRELHLDQGIEVASLEPFDGVRKARTIDPTRELLVECEYFQTERLTLTGSAIIPTPERNTIYVALEGSGSLAGSPFTTGDVWEIPAHTEPVKIESACAVFLSTAAAS